jgi:type II secretory pathway component PulK
MQHTIQHQKGSALLMVLVITTIIASIATIMLIQQRNHISQTQAWLNQHHMRRAASFCMPWATRQLQHPISAPQHMPTMHQDGITIDATLTDLGSQFNLNWLTKKTTQPIFARLLMQLAPSLPMPQAATLSHTIAMQTPTQINQQHAWLSHTELRQLTDLDTTLEKTLEQHTVALPSNQTWNLNSLDTSLLQTIWPTLSDQQITDFSQCRQAHPKLTLKQAKRCLPHDLVWSNLPMGVASHYARLRITLSMHNHQLVLVRDLYHDEHDVHLWRQYDSIEAP